MLAKIGPGENTICRRPFSASSWIMSVPVISDGMRSGVNWIRENFRFSTCASVCTSSVFARPGTPISSELPPTNSDSSMCSTTCSCPMISLPSSAWIRSAPAVTRSASWMSSLSCSPESSITVAKCPPFVGSFFSPSISCISVRQRVDHVVDCQLVRVVRHVHRVEAARLVLHELAYVVVVVHDRELAFRRIVVLEQPPVLRPGSTIALVDRERVQLDVEERPENRLLSCQPDRLQFRQHPPHLLHQILHVPPAEVVEDHEAALEQVSAQARGLLVR